MASLRLHRASFVWVAFAAMAGMPAAFGQEIPRPEHPRPDAVRTKWHNLNGAWKFRFDPNDLGRKENWQETAGKDFDKTITVPFCWESELSGIRDLKYKGAAWYAREFEVPGSFAPEDRVFLRFEAVDYEAEVWVNGKKVAEHEGGYTPFAADITAAVTRDKPNTIVVRAFDATDPKVPTGKQVGWYTSTSGIWQTVWLEARPASYIDAFTIKTAIAPATVTIDLATAGKPAASLSAAVRYQGETHDLATADLQANGSARLTFQVSRPVLWTPENPKLYPIAIILKNKVGIIDEIQTYFGIRTIARGKFGDSGYESVLLNGKPVYLRGALDQSFNPRGIYTAPSDAFLRKDIELAKSLGLNMLRIHIKPDEPRRLYWADKLGIMIFEDMPNTWRQNERARQAWEHTMREAIVRDRNHPSIIAWIDFNETWGLGSAREYQSNADTQSWVQRMMKLTRELDPTRLAEDNSPCNYDHVEGTDLNTWHFYIDDHESAERHIKEVVSKSVPGGGFNYCPGHRMNSAPLLNSEYGGVSAGSGDRDISWAFRDLTTLLRKHEKIQGYVYTELDDIEWEHNGFVNYDRSPKTFGYDAFVPNMTPADLQGADFIGYEGSPAVIVEPNAPIYIEPFISHFSDLEEPPTLRWRAVGVNDLGEKVDLPERTRTTEWRRYKVVPQKRIGLTIDTPFTGAVGLELVDKSGRRIAANFVNVWVRPSSPSPRAEKASDREAVLRFEPADYARAEWTGGVSDSEGKAKGRGAGSFTYRLRLPEAIIGADPVEFTLILEASACADRERVDWPERRNRQDHPQTDLRKWPTDLTISANGKQVASLDLPDDPADARGVLSHLAGVDHGAFGELLKIRFTADEALNNELKKGKPLELSIGVNKSARHIGGLALYGATTGAYPFDPTLVVSTAKDLPDAITPDPARSITLDSQASRSSEPLASGERRTPTRWSYLEGPAPLGWETTGFDSSGWKSGPAGFGAQGTPGIRIRTPWNSNEIHLRATFEMPEIKADQALILRVFHDEDAEIFINGKPLKRLSGFSTSYEDLRLDQAEKSLFRAGKNTIAVRCSQSAGGQGVDLGLRLERSN